MSKLENITSGVRHSVHAAGDPHGAVHAGAAAPHYRGRAAAGAHPLLRQAHRHPARPLRRHPRPQDVAVRPRHGHVPELHQPKLQVSS